MERSLSKVVLKIVFFILIICISFVQATSAFAAVLSISPAAGTYSVGQTVALNVVLSSTDQASNAMSAKIKFPTDKLQLVTISKAGSIVQLWAAEPTFSNEDGTAHFEGVIPNPGYHGAGGRIVTLYFKVKTTGTAQVRYTSASALANDGLGTDILSSYNNAELTLIPAAEAPPPPKQPLPQPSTAPYIETINQPVTTATTTATATPVVSSIMPEQPRLTWSNFFTQFMTSELTFFPFLLALLIALLFFFLYGWYMVRRIKREMRLQVAKLDNNIHRAFHLLHDDITSHLDQLEKARGNRPLTAEEQKFVSYFKHNLKDTEKYLSSDIRALKERIR
jgi:hypothetical protein